MSSDLTVLASDAVVIACAASGCGFRRGRQCVDRYDPIIGRLEPLPHKRPCGPGISCEGSWDLKRRPRVHGRWASRTSFPP